MANVNLNIANQYFEENTGYPNGWTDDDSFFDPAALHVGDGSTVEGMPQPKLTYAPLGENFVLASTSQNVDSDVYQVVDLPEDEVLSGKITWWQGTTRSRNHKLGLGYIFMDANDNEIGSESFSDVKAVGVSDEWVKREFNISAAPANATQIKLIIRFGASGTGDINAHIAGMEAYVTVPDVTEPTVSTGTATSVTDTSASLSGEVTDTGGEALMERGFVYGTSSNPTTADNKKVASGTGIGSISESITGLQDNTTYYFRAYATNSAGTAYGANKSFKTDKTINLPEIETGDVLFFGSDTVMVEGEVISNGGGNVTKIQIEYDKGETPPPSYKTKKIPPSTMGKFRVLIDENVVPGEKHYYRFYIINEAGYYRSEWKTFTTLDAPTASIRNVKKVNNIKQIKL